MLMRALTLASLSESNIAMSDGQTLLDVIGDANVLDSFFTEAPYTPDHNLDSPNFENATGSSEGTFAGASLESLGFETLADHYRTGNPVFQQVVNTGVASASHCLPTSNQYPHQIHNDILQTPHHAGLASPIAGLPHDINRQRDSCSQADNDQASLQQLLSAPSSLASHQHHVHSSQQPVSHVLPPSIVHGQPVIQSSLRPQHVRNQQNQRCLQSLSSDQAIQLSQNILNQADSVVTSLSNRNVSSEQSCSQLTAVETPTEGTATSKSHVSVPQGVALPGFGKVQVLAGPNQILPTNVFSSSNQLSGQVISGASLLPGNQVLPTNSILQPGQVFPGANVLQGAHILTNVLNNTNVVTTVGGSQPQPLYVSPHNAGLSPHSTLSLTSTSSTVPNTVVHSLSAFPPPLSTASHPPKTLARNSTTSPASSPQAVIIQKSATPQVQAPSYNTPSSTVLTANVSMDGVFPGLVPNISVAPRTSSHNVIFTQANMSSSGQVSSGVKQVVSGGQLLQIVGTSHSKQPVTHVAPKPIQPKPQILPRPLAPSIVRQPTPPPAGKTLIGTRPVQPTSQPAIVLGAGQQPTVISQQPLNGFVINSNMFGGNSYLVPQPNGAPPLLVRLAPTNTAPNQAIMAPVGTSQILPMNKLQPQTIVLPPGGHTQPVVIPHGLAPSLPGGALFSAAQRPQQPIFRFVSQPPLQLQYQAANGAPLLAIPTQQAGLNLSNLLAAAPGGARAITPQVAQPSFQLASVNAASAANLGGLQLSGTTYQANTSQPIQVNAASLVNNTASAGIQPTLIVKGNQPTALVTTAAPTVSAPQIKLSGDRSSKKASKKKKKSTEPKDEKVSLINIGDILRQNGIDNSICYDSYEDEDFGNATNNQLQTVEKPQEVPAVTMASALTPTANSLCVPTTTDAISSPITTSSLQGLCITIDQSGNYMLAPQAITKTAPAALAPQQPVVHTMPLQNMQLLASSNFPSAAGETLILGAMNDKGHLPVDKPPQQSQFVAVTNAQGGHSLMRVEVGPNPQIPATSKAKSENRAPINMLPNTISACPLKNTFVAPLMSPDSHLSRMEAPPKVGLTKMNLTSKNSQIVHSCSTISPIKDTDVQAAKVATATNTYENSGRPALAAALSSSASYSNLNNKNTYQHKYIESVKPPLQENAVKNKKSGKKRKRDHSTETRIEMPRQIMANENTLQPKTIGTPARTEDCLKEQPNVPGASMPSIFMPCISSGTNIAPSINTVTVGVTNSDMAAQGKKTSPTIFSPPANYVVAGHDRRQQKQVPQRARPASQTIQVMLSPKSQEVLKKVGAQIQALKGKGTMTVDEKDLWAKLIAEYNRIISQATPVSPQNTTPASNSVAPNSRTAIKYSHSVGHQKIILTPPQKKGYSTSVHLQAKDIHNDHSKKDAFLSSSQAALINYASPAVATNAPAAIVPVVSSFTTTRPTVPDSSKNDAVEVKSSNYLSQVQNYSQASAASAAGFSSARMSSPPQHHRMGEGHHLAARAGTSGQARLNVCQQASSSISQVTATSPIRPPLTRDHLFGHQLRTDQSGALNPDCETPFRNRTDACKRLIRYHCFNGSDPTQSQIAEQEATVVTQVGAVWKKAGAMMHKFQSLCFRDSTQRNPSAEDVMMLRHMIQEEKGILEREKAEVRSGLGIDPYLAYADPAGSSFSDLSFEESWTNDIIYKVNPETANLSKVGGTPPDYETLNTPERPESEEPRLQVHVDEEADLQSRESDESIARIAQRIVANDFTTSSSDADTRSPMVPLADANQTAYNANELTAGTSAGYASVANGIEGATSSSDSVFTSSPFDRHCSRKDHKKKKSKHRSRSKKRCKRPLGELQCGGQPDSPSEAPIKLLLKKRHLGEGYYSSSQLEAPSSNVVESRGGRRQKAETDESYHTDSTASSQPIRYDTANHSHHGPQDVVGYNVNSHYEGNSNFDYSYS